MPKIKFVFVFLSTLFLGNDVFSQRLNCENLNRVVYKKARYLKTDYNQSKSTEAIAIHKEYMKALDRVEYTLLFNCEKSLFEIIEKLEFDNDMGYKIASMIGGGLGKSYKDMNDKIKLRQTEYDGEKFNIVFPFDEYGWEISDESKIINGFLCYKATSIKAEHDYIRDRKNEFRPQVWFTPDIPVSFGPEGMDGLPGLVLEGTINGDIYFYATEIELNLPSKDIKKPRGGKNVTQEEFNLLISKRKY